MSIRRVVPNIESPKLSESREFYVDALGFDMVMDMGWIITFASPSNATAQVQVLASDASAPVVPALSIEVEDVDAVHAAVVERGYAIEYPLTDEAWGVRRFFARDPNGLVVNIASHRVETSES
jgi:catechol 2,3-dioxygenase-like lactoylglutathione lyase family enzyme